jgi:peroxiredoxin family protein
VDYKNKEGELIMPDNKSMTIILHSGELDKALAAFIIATGAAAKGVKTTMFFSFWGLNIIKKEGATKAKLSNMNMAGLGKMMIKKKMKEKNVAPLEELIKDSKELGVKLIACEMTMDLMNVTKDMLISEVTEIGGVGTYLDDALKSDVNLFI